MKQFSSDIINSLDSFLQQENIHSKITNIFFLKNKKFNDYMLANNLWE